MNIVDERIAELIQAEVDGALAESEREVLQAELARSAAARAYRDEMMHLAKILGEVPDLEPPPGLNRRILDSIELPAPRQLPAWLRNWFRPASYGLAVAAGMLLAVGMIRILPVSNSDMFGEMSSLAGSMVKHDKVLPDASRSQLAVDLEVVEGSILLKEMNGTLALQFDLDSVGPVEINIPLARSGMEFGGFVHDAKGMEVLEVSEGNLRVVNQGSRQFVVFLRRPGVSSEEMANGAASDLAVTISQDNRNIFKGTIALGG